MNWITYTVMCGGKFMTINSCNDAVGVFRGAFPEVKVKSWKTDGKTTVINGDESMTVTEHSL